MPCLCSIDSPNAIAHTHWKRNPSGGINGTPHGFWDAAPSDAPHRCDQTVGSIFMSRLRHCVECPKCRTRYLPSFSPYRNGSYLIPLTENGASGWILYCSCSMPAASSQWGSMDLKPYEICGQAYRRGYGSPEEVWDLTRDSRVDPNWQDVDRRL